MNLYELLEKEKLSEEDMKELAEGAYRVGDKLGISKKSLLNDTWMEECKEEFISLIEEAKQKYFRAITKYMISIEEKGTEVDMYTFLDVSWEIYQNLEEKIEEETKKKEINSLENLLEKDKFSKEEMLRLVKKAEMFGDDVWRISEEVLNDTQEFNLDAQQYYFKKILEYVLDCEKTGFKGDFNKVMSIYNTTKQEFGIPIEEENDENYDSWYKRFNP
jgi:hypothetical protein